ncbi:uncharacterized protein LOC124273186 [Haliotis rubra]|uniref:uncharacterized protein LOC124273186 n=1 Tax=Haliotis rubra TaxID=36100 RepID=UPI001EE52D65|nr:uncharacterized protein LOC124273186 [Haliotis rubra]
MNSSCTSLQHSNRCKCFKYHLSESVPSASCRKMDLLVVACVLLSPVLRVYPVCLNIPALVQNHTSLRNHGYRRLQPSNLLQCASECLRSTHCKSFNFHSENFECFLNTEDGTGAPNDVIAIDNIVYADKSDWPLSLSGPCRNVTFPAMERCDIDRSQLAICVQDDVSCGAPPTVTNATLEYDGRYPGAIASYSCPVNFRLCGSNVSTCSAGSWVGHSTACKQYRWINPSSETDYPVPCEFNIGWSVLLRGNVIPSETRFKINLKPKPTWFLMHVVINMDYRTLSINVAAPNWQAEETIDTSSYFPFERGHDFEVTILRDSATSHQITFNNTLTYTFNDRLPGEVTAWVHCESTNNVFSEIVVIPPN